MKKLELIKGADKATKQHVNNFVESKNIKIPDKLIDFWVKQNPVEVKESCFIKNSNEYQVLFFPFAEDYPEWTFQNAFENLFVDFFEKNYVSFGSDPGGWQFVISVQKSDFGKVYFCRMDEALEDALTLLADSFEEFIDGLEIEP